MKKKIDNSSYYFTAWYDNDVGMTCAAIVSKPFFDKKQSVFDEKLSKQKDLEIPEGWYEQEKGILYFEDGEELTLKEVKQIFLSAGFIENKEFDRCIDQYLDNIYQNKKE